MTEALAKQESAAVEAQQGNPSALLQIAVENGADVDKLAKLMDLQERWDAKQAKRAFDEAMAAMQRDIPVIEKKREVRNRNGQLLYKHANTDDISTAIRPVEHGNGFSHRFDFEPLDGGGCKTTCIVRHIGGHEEKTTVTIPATSGNNTNAAQNRGIEMQYGMKYSLCGAYGITSADEDTDANVPAETITPDQAKHLRQLVSKARFDETRQEAMLAYAGADSIDTIPTAAYQEICDACLKAIKSNQANDELPL